MSVLAFALGLEPRHAARVELFVSDLPLARALHEGSPAARLLARTRLASDEADLSHGESARLPLAHQTRTSTWDVLVRTLTQDSRPLLERIKRAVARHTRAASVEGPISAPAWVVTALLVAVATSDDVDASVAEVGSPALHRDGLGSGGDALSAFADRCAAHDPRFGHVGVDLRAPLFEACLRLAARASGLSSPHDAAVSAFAMLSQIHDGAPLPQRLATRLHPHDTTPSGDVGRRVALLDRAPFDALVARDPRDLAAAISRWDRGATFSPVTSPLAPGRGAPGAHLDTFVADLTKLLAAPGALLLALLPPAPRLAALLDQHATAATPGAPDAAPSMRPPSWLPQDWSAPDTSSTLADSIERGTTTLPRARLAVRRGGDAALDAIGAEMLHASAHPFASAAFAEVLARSSRPRDIMRLVTYFAIAPDPTLAARALSACGAPELPRVLAAWLEAMLPSDGALVDQGDDPDRSSAARLTACIASLSPYPHLHRAVAPLLTRVSEAPAPASHA